MRLIRGLFLKPTLNLLSWILKGGNSLIIGGPLGWSWQSTLDTTHHGSLAGPANAHRHSDLANIGIDDHHARDHAVRHAVGGGDQVSLDASQIGSGRFGKTRVEGTANKLWKFAGAGADPTEIDEPTSLVFTELAGGQAQGPSSTDTWLDWDISAIVPAGTKYVLVGGAPISTSSSSIVGARKNGTALDRRFQIAQTSISGFDGLSNVVVLTEVDANRIIEIWTRSQSGGKFNIVGYWS